MPLIPLFNQGQTVKQPTVAAPPQQSRTRIVMDAADSVRGFATPLLPAQLADKSGIIDLGEGMQRLGMAINQVGKKQQEAVNIRHVAEAEGVMNQRYSEFENWKLKNPDETKWMDEWKKRSASLKAEIFHDGLSPQARTEIENAMLRFGSDSSIRVSTDSAKASFAKAGETLISQALDLYKANDKKGAEEILRRGVDGGFIDGLLAKRYQIAGETDVDRRLRDDLRNSVSANLDNLLFDDAKKDIAMARQNNVIDDNEAKAMVAEIDRKFVSRQQEDQIDNLMMEKPQEVRDKLQKGEWNKISPETRDAKIAETVKVQAIFAENAFNDIKQRIDNPPDGQEIKSDEKFDGPVFEMLTPQMRQNLIAYNKQKKIAEAHNNDEIFTRTLTRIEKYIPKENDALGQANVKQFIELYFSGAKREALLQRFNEKIGEDGFKPSVGEAFEALDNWVLGPEKMLGKFTEQETVDGNKVVKKQTKTVEVPGWIWGTNLNEIESYVPVEIENSEKKQEILKKMEAIKDAVRREVANGTLKTSDDVWNRVARAVGVEARKNTVRDIDDTSYVPLKPGEEHPLPPSFDPKSVKGGGSSGTNQLLPSPQEIDDMIEELNPNAAQ